MSNIKKKGLGRGLSALFGDQKKILENKEIESVQTKALIGDLNRNKFQPRIIFDNNKLDELSKSIKKNGVIQPIAVREDRTDPGRYEIIAGERRWLAAQKAGMHEVPVVITEVDDLKSLEFAIVENVQRHDLNAIEEAQGYQSLINDFGYDQEKVAKFIGKSRSYITNTLRLLNLPEEVLKLVEDRSITAGHAKILVGLDNALFLAKKIIEKKLSVRQTENFVKVLKKNKGSLKNTIDSNVLSLQNEIREKIGINVFIKNKKNNTGSIIFDYKDLDQLNRIIDIIKTNY